MDEIWTSLGLEPTRDVAAIRRAYGEKEKQCRPEEGREELLRAYRAALAWAEENTNSREKGNAGRWEDPGNGDWMPAEEPEDGPNPFADSEAIRQFAALYTGKQRKNPKLWMDYFTSDAFLNAAWEPQFTALLLETVTGAEPDLKPNKEFVQWLSIAYQVSVGWTEDQVPRPYIRQDGQFQGQESIFRLVAKGPIPKQPRQNELAILNSFADYRLLVGLAEQGTWDEAALEEFKWVADRYASAYIKERCEQRASPDCERHPAGLRVFVHFFRRSDLPEEVYRYVWDRFDLKNALMGRSKVLYGALRELVIEHVPGIDGEEVENFLKLNQERDACYGRIKARPETEEDELDALFALEAMQKALRSRQFMDKQLKYYYNWLNSWAPEGMIRRIAEFYRAHPEIPGGDRVADCAERQLKERAKAKQRQEEERRRLETEVSPEDLDLSLLTAVPYQIIVQPLTGLEVVYKPKDWVDPEEEGDEPPEEEELEELEEEELEETEVWTDPVEKFAMRNAKPLSEEGLIELIGQFAGGKLLQMELWLHSGVLVLTRSGEKYACFYFEYGYDTWYTMLSQPEVYRTVDCKEVVSEPFGMGRLESYNIHDSAGSILRNLNLVFTQISRGRPQVHMEETWLWSTDTYLQNGGHKKRMAMQKLAGIPASRARGYILGKFVFKQYPSEVDRMSLEGEREFTVLKPGGYGLASNELVRFFQGKLEMLRLSWNIKTPEGGACQRHMVLLQDNGAFMMVWLRDDRQDAGLYTSDEPRTFYGQVYPASPVHLELERIRNCVDLLLDDMTCADQITQRPGQFIPVDRPYEQVRRALVDSRQ